jgi:cystathionine beta-lyase
VVESPLIYEAGAYRMDFADLAERLADPAITLLVLCNPQNPTGNVWSVGDLARLGELCAEHGVTVLSDEAHCDLTRPGLSHTPFARVNEQCRRISVTCCSPSKPFNIAGIQSSYLFVDDPELRERIAQGLLEDCFSMPNDFACASTVAAYEGGEEWLDELRAYIQANKDLFASFVDEWIPGLTVVPSDAMYLSWVDGSGLTDDSEALAAFLREKAKLFVTQGDEYGTGGKGFLRVNLATNRARVEEGLRRLEAGCAAFREERGLN